ncbi:MAG: cysteine desulfurase DndA, partial [Lachnospiraceae bacterium]|nr:cysteine desulfurase DndA [Lachnospiraceae bacterium]
GVESEALMLSSKQYCGISNGSACTSHDYSPSYVLKAMGLDEERLSEAIRISWGPKTVVEEMEKELSDLLSVAKGLAW